MKINISSILAVTLVSGALFFSGCGDSSSDDNKAKAAAGSDISELTSQFSDYASNGTKWEKIETLFAPDPAVDPQLSTAHGTGKLFRTIYKSPVGATLENGVYADGTMFVKELEKNINGDIGDVAGSTTVMIKENGEWRYIKLNPALTEIEAMGTPQANEVNSVGGCIGCHSQAKSDYDFTFAPSIAEIDMDKNLDEINPAYRVSSNYTLIDTVKGQDPAGTLFGSVHGLDKDLFRKVYKHQLSPKLNGEYPVGTVFVKELNLPDEADASKAGSLTGPLTIMLKRESGADETNNWEYFMTNEDRSAIVLQGMSSNPNVSPENNVSGCISCHAIAQSRDINNDYIFKTTPPANATPAVVTPPATTTPVAVEAPDALLRGAEIVERVGCSATFCHGQKLNGIGGNGYNIASRSSDFIKAELTKFKSGARDGGTMPGIATQITAEEIEILSQYVPTVK